MIRWLAVIALAASCGKKGPHVELAFELEPSCAAHAPADALDRTLVQMRERLSEMGLNETVSTRDGKLIVELAGQPDESLVQDARMLVMRTAVLDMKLVDEGSDFMRQLCEQAARDPKAQEVEISVGHDRACYLQAPDHWLERKVTHGSDIIREYIAQLAKTDPYYVLPTDAPLAFGEIGTHETRATRTYWLHPESVFAASNVLGARGSYDLDTDAPIAEMKLSLAGERAYAALAKNHGGEPLAILLDGKVRQVATLDPRMLHGDTVKFLLGGNTVSDRERLRDDLVAVLQVGSLPCPLREVTGR